jgi:hypothetical protein
VAWFHVVQGRGILSSDGFDKIVAADRFRLRFNLLGVSVAFPTNAGELIADSSKRHWEDGPRAISELRNSIVHPKKRATFYDAPEPVRKQVRGLTLLYLASALARLFGYDGKLAKPLKMWLDATCRVGLLPKGTPLRTG